VHHYIYEILYLVLFNLTLLCVQLMSRCKKINCPCDLPTFWPLIHCHIIGYCSTIYWRHCQSCKCKFPLTPIFSCFFLKSKRSFIKKRKAPLSTLGVYKGTTKANQFSLALFRLFCLFGDSCCTLNYTHKLSCLCIIHGACYIYINMNLLRRKSNNFLLQKPKHKIEGSWKRLDMLKL
jgi:hypothetical protein